MSRDRGYSAPTGTRPSIRVPVSRCCTISQCFPVGTTCSAARTNSVSAVRRDAFVLLGVDPGEVVWRGGWGVRGWGEDTGRKNKTLAQGDSIWGQRGADPWLSLDGPVRPGDTMTSSLSTGLLDAQGLSERCRTLRNREEARGYRNKNLALCRASQPASHQPIVHPSLAQHPAIQLISHTM